jgi:outer membrane receptor protein involved in Fe transport
LIGSKKFNTADRTINYKTLLKSGQSAYESVKEIDIDLDNYTIDGTLNYKYDFKRKRYLTSKLHYSIFDQLQKMNNVYYPEISNSTSALQNTYSKQYNKQADFSIDYTHPLKDSMEFETGYNFNSKDLLNDFNSETQSSSGIWLSDTALNNQFNYIQLIHSVYFNFITKFKAIELQAGVRSEYTSNYQDINNTEEYIDFFPSVNLSRKLSNHFTLYGAYSRRINRPTIKMLNPFSDEYADILNMHTGNPDLKPEYVNSVEIGNRFVFKQFSGFVSVYHRHIVQAISRIKSASNDSALIVTFTNLDKAKLTGGELSLMFKPFDWWNINSNSNIFYTSLSGEYGNNKVNTSKMGWNLSLTNSFKIPKGFGFQLAVYYRSKLPSVMGVYQERYYADLALSKKILKNKAQVVFKISDIFNTYKYGFDLDAIDDNGYRYSQINRRKNESRYFILSFIYNINGKDQQQKKQKENFFLDDFDK